MSENVEIKQKGYRSRLEGLSQVLKAKGYSQEGGFILKAPDYPQDDSNMIRVIKSQLRKKNPQAIEADMPGQLQAYVMERIARIRHLSQPQPFDQKLSKQIETFLDNLSHVNTETEYAVAAIKELARLRNKASIQASSEPAVPSKSWRSYFSFPYFV